jgi:hypothetical protein
METYMTDTAEQKHHYHLVSGEVVFRVPETEDIAVSRMNAMLTTEDSNLTLRHIARAQQALQQNFFKSIESIPEVINVVILSISHLGLMTSEQFNQAPEGMTLQESAPEPVN